jgi:DNA-binding NarL/FixJ family response regulator
MSIRLLIVDDQELIRVGLRLFLESHDEMKVVAEAADGAAAIERARALRPDVVLMDVRMPRMDGVEATARIMGDGLEPAPRVLVLTTFDLDRYVFGALRAGAAGFLLKDAPRERLLEAIRVVHGGEALLAPSITRRLIETFAARTDPIEPPHALLDELTPRERETLMLVARGLSNGEIAERLVVTEATVKSHVGALLLKLGLRDRVQVVVFAYEHGIVSAGERRVMLSGAAESARRPG